MPRKRPISELERSFLHGAAWALSVLTQGFGHAHMAAMIASEGNFSVADFEAAETEECDMDGWADELRAIERRKRKRPRRSKAATAGRHHAQ